MLAGTVPSEAPSYENMSSSELEAFLTEMEPDIRAADRDMREIEMLEKKGVTGAGKLPGTHMWNVFAPLPGRSITISVDYEALTPRLETLLDNNAEDVKFAASLEKRIAALMERHAIHVFARFVLAFTGVSLTIANTGGRSL